MVKYYKVNPLKYDEIKCIYNALDSNPLFNKLENKICYLSCCLYLLTKKDDKNITIFCQKVFSKLIEKKFEMLKWKKEFSTSRTLLHLLRLP